jgi:hypothetical protein
VVLTIPRQRPKAPRERGPFARVDIVALRSLARTEAGKTPTEVYAALSPRLVSPASFLKGTFEGYRFDPKDVDEVMMRYGIGDVRALLRTAIALHRGDHCLSRDELIAAAQKESSYVSKGVKFSHVVLADIMKKTGIAEESALVRTALRFDDGDCVLTRGELERAAALLVSVVGAHDVAAIVERVDAIGAAPKSAARVDVLGTVAGFPIQVLTFPARRQPPKLTVFVSGGVHGNEPCGAASALLLAEQLAHAATAGAPLRDEIDFVVVPLVNPRGTARGTRKTPDDLDLNRSFGSDAPEARLVRDLLTRVRPDIAIDLHSAVAAANGFFVIHDGGSGGGALAKGAMARFRVHWPTITNAPVPYVLSEPGVSVSTNEGTLKNAAMREGAKASFTVEAPGSVGYLDQVLGENELVHSLVEAALVSYGR